jgi:hypothetical protein
LEIERERESKEKSKGREREDVGVGGEMRVEYGVVWLAVTFRYSLLTFVPYFLPSLLTQMHVIKDL